MMTAKEAQQLLTSGKIRAITGLSAPSAAQLPAGKAKVPKPVSLAKEGFKIALWAYCQKYGKPLFEEQLFHETRKWRLDFVIPGPRPVVLEYEGIFSNDNGQNGHTGVKHFIKDTQKYNAAALQGLTVIRYTANNYREFFHDLNKFYKL